MFDLVRNNKKFVQIFLLLITLPFAFWGVESYVRNAGNDKAVAEVGGSKIRPAELQQALREQQDRLRSAMGANYNPAMLETPTARAAVLDNLINQRLLSLHLAKSKVMVPDQLLRETIAGIPAFQENGQFSIKRYQAALQAQGMNESVFENRVRQDLAFQQVIGAVADGSIVARASAERMLAVQLEERDISQVVLSGKQFESQVKLADGAAKGFYDANRKRFELPAQVRADFVVLNQDALADQAAVSDADARKWYDEHPDRYRQGEERRASHILILADKSAPEAAQKAAKAKAEALLKQVRANPAAFATLAKENSQDPGSAQNGGDLGYFGHGAMVKPFEDAAFALKDGEISDVVHTDYGYHIIRITGIKASKAQPFEAVKADILAELKRTQAGKKFAELAESFSNTVYEQADSLKPAADKFKLPVQHSGWIARGAQAAPPFNNEKLIAALFSDDAVKNKRNTDAVDLGNNTLVAARVAEYKPAALRPFEEVKADIERMLVAEEAAKLAAKDGAAKLASLQKGEKIDLAWAEGRKLQRGAPALPPEAMRAVFSAPADKLPAYAGVNLPGAGYVLFRIEKVAHPAVQEGDPRLQTIRGQYARLLADQDFSAYMSALRKLYGVKIDKAQLEAKEK